jgi:LysR family transcriptional activator of nhaA
MDWLNYHHLLYFWTVAKEGSIAKATARLHLAQPTISAQIKVFESRMGQKLFQRKGRRLVLTEAGRTVLHYADEIFSLGKDLMCAVKEPDRGRPNPFEVGVAHVIPMLLVEVLLRPTRSSIRNMRLICREGRLPELLSALSMGDLDIVLTSQQTPRSKSGPTTISSVNAA